MNKSQLIKIILIIIVVFILFLVIFGLLIKPKPEAVIIAATPGAFNRTCLTEKVQCKTDNDCQTVCREAGEGEEMACVELKRYTDEQTQNYGPAEKYCVLAGVKDTCDPTYGGLKVWSGWSDPDRMEWDCVCSYPAYAGTPGCHNINAGICQPGKFNWTVEDGENPSAKYCECGPGTIPMKTIDGQKPICVPEKLKSWYTDINQTI